MAKRHESLVSLSHDHHHGLALALRLRQGDKALLNDGWTHDRHTQARIVQKFYVDELSIHFQLEEEILFPAMLKHISGSFQQVDLLVAQHRQMEGLILQLQTDDSRLLERVLVDLGNVLEQHIRSEERELFATFEEQMSPAMKQLLGVEMQQRLKELTTFRQQ